MPESNKAPQDFSAALREIKGNFDIRRLLFVITNLVLPGVVIALGDLVSGPEYPESGMWFARHIFEFAGLVVILLGFVVGKILVRCHYGLVINGAKLNVSKDGSAKLLSLNWLGVTGSFIILSALSVGAATFVVAKCFLDFRLSVILGVIAFLINPLLLNLNHWRANRALKKLIPSWSKEDVSQENEEHHAILSLEATNQDIAVIVAMAAALFVGFFSAIANFGSMQESVDYDIPAALVKRYAIFFVSSYLVVTMALSALMVVRLRVSIAEFSETLARLRNEPDDPWRFKFSERTFSLYMFIVMLGSFSTYLLFRSLECFDGFEAASGDLWGRFSFFMAGTVAIIGTIWYAGKLGLTKFIRSRKK
ncbi:MAG: hypothetical protein NUW37_14155 [Planctomycetes bacterium]|nr:hypothetical protein [Planctomycetota bacterium]